MKITQTELTKLQTLTAPEIAREMCGRQLAIPNGWEGGGIVVGAWRAQGTIRLLLAWPTAENPSQLFNERIEGLTEANAEVSHDQNGEKKL
jgi:hypothetical protein